MTANAVATNPAKAAGPKKNLKQPPADSVWLRYHPWMEGLMGHVASWAIHLLVIGGVLLWCGFLMYYFGFARPPHALPMEPVTFDAGGGGDPTAAGNDRNAQGPLPEGVHADKNNPGNTTNPNESNDRPQLNDPTVAKDNIDFSPNRQIPANPETGKSIANLQKSLADKLGDGRNPSPGVNGPGTSPGTGDGPGKGPGKGPGTGPGTGQVKTERLKQLDRWEMSMPTRGDFLSRLQKIGTTLAIPANPRDLDSSTFTIIDLTKQPRQEKQGTKADLAALNQIWWYVEKPRDIQDLMTQLGKAGQPTLILAFMNQDLEDDLAAHELKFTGLHKEEISSKIDKTYFKVNVDGQMQWTIEVTGTKPK
jgi:hypothetical protein